MGDHLLDVATIFGHRDRGKLIIILHKWIIIDVI